MAARRAALVAAAPLRVLRRRRRAGLGFVRGVPGRAAAVALQLSRLRPAVACQWTLRPLPAATASLRSRRGGIPQTSAAGYANPAVEVRQAASARPPLGRAP